mgnify:FL=1
MGWVSTERNHDEQPITVGVIDDDPMICQMMRVISSPSISTSGVVI